MHSSQLTHLFTLCNPNRMDGASVYMQSSITICSHPLPFHNRRTQHVRRLRMDTAHGEPMRCWVSASMLSHHLEVVQLP
jgi:hypothetical protein